MTLANISRHAPQPGSSCPIDGGDLPGYGGALATGAGCGECCTLEFPDDYPNYGVNYPCHDHGLDHECVDVSRELEIVSGSSATGQSVLSLEYLVSFTVIPPDSRIIRALAYYGLSTFFPASPEICDTTLTRICVAGTSAVIEWTPSNLEWLNWLLGQQDTFVATATAEWGGGMGGNFSVSKFEVYYCSHHL